MPELKQIIHGDSQLELDKLPENYVDCMITDPPYGYKFLQRDWDKAVIGVEHWKKCLRVLKPGSLAFVMSAPRQDVLARVICNLQDAGFKTDFTSTYWAYASGFPKAGNIGKLIDKRNGRVTEDYTKLANHIKSQRKKLGISSTTIAKLFPSQTGGLTGCLWNWENAMNVPTIQQWKILQETLHLSNDYDDLIQRVEAQREITGQHKNYSLKSSSYKINHTDSLIYDQKRKPKTSLAKRLHGAYAGYQPKPAVEIIITAMKPITEKTFADQAIKNNKGVTWLDDVKIPFINDDDKPTATTSQDFHDVGKKMKAATGKNSRSFGNAAPNAKRIKYNPDETGRFPANLLVSDGVLDTGKTTKSQGGQGTRDTAFFGQSDYTMKHYGDIGDFSRYFDLDAWFYDHLSQFIITPKASKSEKQKGLTQKPKQPKRNMHPTVKPITLFCYLVTLATRPNDIVLDPFLGSGTLAISCETLARNYIGIEQDKEYIKITNARLEQFQKTRKLDLFVQ